MCIDDMGGKVHVFSYSAPTLSSTDDKWHIILCQLASYFFHGVVCQINGMAQFQSIFQLEAHLGGGGGG